MQSIKILTAAKEKCQVTYRGRPIRITPDFSLETMKARMSWSSVIQILKDPGFQPRILNSAKLSIPMEGENKIFHGKTRFHQYLATNPALHKILK